MAQQFLHRADIVARLQQVRGKGMAQHVAIDAFVNTGLAGGPVNGLLQRAFMNMVAAVLTGTGVDG